MTVKLATSSDKPSNLLQAESIMAVGSTYGIPGRLRILFHVEKHAFSLGPRFLFTCASEALGYVSD